MFGSLFSIVGSNLWPPWLVCFPGMSPPKVLNTLSMDLGTVPKAFPLSDQYIKNQAAETATDDEADQEAKPAKAQKGKAVTKKKCVARKPVKLNLLKRLAAAKQAKSAVREIDGLQKVDDDDGQQCYSPQLYGEKRKAYIEACGKSYREACRDWADSMERAAILATLEVSELKRRRFVSKGCTENPFKVKLQTASS